jgi:hypothetical protein
MGTFKGQGNEPVFSIFLHKSSRSDFGFVFAEIFVIESRLPAINDMGNRRLPVSVSRVSLSEKNSTSMSTTLKRSETNAYSKTEKRSKRTLLIPQSTP